MKLYYGYINNKQVCFATTIYDIALQLNISYLTASKIIDSIPTSYNNIKIIKIIK